MARERERRRLQRILVALSLLAAVALTGVAMAYPDPAADRSAPVHGQGAWGAAASSLPWPAEGPGTWEYELQPGEVLGAGGGLRQFRVAVEEGVPVEVAAFTSEVETILGAERGWTAGDEYRFQRVAQDNPFDFVIFLATPGTSEEMCATGGIHTGGLTSCHLAAQVIINVGQWLAGAPGYAAPLPDYRAYLLNHLVGRELGYGPQACPGAGQPAPVMLPQTRGLDGCTPNAWPYRGRVRYVGPPIP